MPILRPARDQVQAPGVVEVQLVEEFLYEARDEGPVEADWLGPSLEVHDEDVRLLGRVKCSFALVRYPRSVSTQ